MTTKLKTFLLAPVALGCLEINVLAMDERIDPELDPNAYRTTSKVPDKQFTPEEVDVEASFISAILESYREIQGTQPVQKENDEELPIYSVDPRKRESNIETIREKNEIALREAFEEENAFEVSVGGLSTEKREKKYMPILSLDGGGFRGYMEALWLHELKSITGGREPHQLFDLIAGTSIGGILAAAATTPKHGHVTSPALSTDDMVELFEKNGEKIFPQRRMYNIPGRGWDAVCSLFVARYDATPLEEMLISHFRNNRLHSALTPMMITAATVQKIPVLFSSFDVSTKDYMMWEVARATSAAPSYFRAFPLVNPQTEERQYLVDGGVWHNNPAKLACDAALGWAKTETYQVNLSNMIMLSLGTGEMPGCIQHYNAGLYNVLRSILGTLMDTASEGVHQSVESVLQGKNYKRINPKFDKEIKLDAVDEESIAILYDKAKSKFGDLQEFYDNSALRLAVEEREKEK